MTFVQVCVGIVICLGLLFITGLFGKLISWTTDDESMWFFYILVLLYHWICCVFNYCSLYKRRTLVKRISKTEYYLGIAEAVSKRSTCRRQYGAIIVKNDEIILYRL